MTASHKPIGLHTHCPLCGTELHAPLPLVDENPLSPLESGNTLLSQLPPSNHPWIAIMFGDLLIFANEEWAPYFVDPDDGTLHVIPAHVPTAENAETPIWRCPGGGDCK